METVFPICIGIFLKEMYKDSVLLGIPYMRRDLSTLLESFPIEEGYSLYA